jgi:hypothetical protein
MNECPSRTAALAAEPAALALAAEPTAAAAAALAAEPAAALAAKPTPLAAAKAHGHVVVVIRLALRAAVA